MIRIWPFSANRSAAYTVHEPPEIEGTLPERAERLVFVADGFSWMAALFGPFYLAVKREWIALALYVAALVTLVNVLNLAGMEEQWISWSLLLLNVILGFEMSDIRRRSLRRAGWSELGTVTGDAVEDAERRFFDGWLAAAPPSGETGEGAEAPASPPGPSHAAPHHDAVSRADTLLRRLSSRFPRKSFPT